MTLITVNISDKKSHMINKEELESLLDDFVAEYIEIQEDNLLKQELAGDIEFVSLNRKLEEKIGNMIL